MWFEILPSGAVIVLAFYATTYTNYLGNKLFLGNYFKRTMSGQWEAAMFCRDYRLTGDAYTPNGLDAFDFPETKEVKK